MRSEQPDTQAGPDTPRAESSRSSSQPDLPLDLVLDHSSRDGEAVSFLCAAACVCRAWRSLLRRPCLWSRLHGLPKGVTDAQLAGVLARALHKVTSLDIRACYALSDAGIVAALKGQPGLQNADLRCTQLSSGGLAAAMLGRRLRSLKAHGLLTSDCPSEVVGDIAALRRICPSVDVTHSCTTADYDSVTSQRLCGEMPLLELGGLGEYCKKCPFPRECRSCAPDTMICSLW